MGKWMDLAAELEGSTDTRDNRDNRDNRCANVPIVPNVPVRLPPDIRAGLITLRSMAAPRLILPEGWPAAVSDALRLAQDGWASKALALGWSPLDLFGVVPDSLGDPAGDGLAVWLDGRRLIALCGTYAVAEDDGGGRSYFNRRQADDAVLLWELGR